MAVTENPLPTDDIPGYLTSDQEQSLRDFWARFFKLADDAPEEGKGGGGSAGGMNDMDEKKPGKDIPKDDEAKAKMRAEEEMKNANAALQQYGSKKFLATYWRLVASDDPDMIMMRFCRARKYDINAGVSMLASCIKWRMEGDVEKIVQKGEWGMRDAEGFLKQMEIGKTYTQGTDRKGRPVVYIHVAKHKLFDQSAKALEDFVIFQMENVRYLLADRADKVTMVFNMTGFGLANMDWKCILFIVKCLEAYYPESLNCMIIHSAPWVFQGIWKILAPMLDPVVRAKVQMTKSNADLQVHIPPEHLIKQLGGNNDWEWEFTPPTEEEAEPQQDKAMVKKLTAQREKLIQQYTDVTRKWAKSDGHDEALNLTRELLRNRLRVQSYALDPYARGRSVYHRHGNIVGNGLVSFEYPSSQGPEWEVRGYDKCRESLQVRNEFLETQIKAAGGKVPPSVEGGKAEAGSDDEDEAPKKRERRKSRSSRS